MADKNGWNILHDAVLGGHAEMVQHIVKLQPGKSVYRFVTKRSLNVL